MLALAHLADTFGKVMMRQESKNCFSRSSRILQKSKPIAVILFRAIGRTAVRMPGFNDDSKKKI